MIGFLCHSSAGLHYEKRPHFVKNQPFDSVKFVSKLYSYPVIICSKLTTKTLEQGRKYAQINVVVIVNFEHISHLVLVFLLLTLYM